MPYLLIALLSVVGLPIALMCHALPKIRYQKLIDRILPLHLLHKDCPHCSKSNDLTAMDLIKSFYLGNTHDNGFARHWCHHCQKGWDTRFFWLFSLVSFFLAFAMTLLAIKLCKDEMGYVFLKSNSSSDQLFAFAFILASCFVFAFFDFFGRVLLVKLLPLRKQT